LNSGKTFEFRRPPPGIFGPSSRYRPDSGKRHGNPARGTACRNTDEFPVPELPSFIGGLMALSKKA
jgi:hypothetical protein